MNEVNWDADLVDEDYFEGYNESIKQNFDANLIEYQKLTHKIFTSEDGKKWLKQTMNMAFRDIVDLEHGWASAKLAESQGKRAFICDIQKQILAHKNFILSAEMQQTREAKQ